MDNNLSDPNSLRNFIVNDPHHIEATNKNLTDAIAKFNFLSISLIDYCHDVGIIERSRGDYFACISYASGNVIEIKYWDNLNKKLVDHSILFKEFAKWKQRDI